jgi:hypothetical protein
MRLNMSSCRHPETDGLTEHVNSTVRQLFPCFYCYDGLDWTAVQIQVEYAYNTCSALKTEDTPFEVNFYCLQEPPDMQLSMRPSIPVSQDAT